MRFCVKIYYAIDVSRIQWKFRLLQLATVFRHSLFFFACCLTRALLYFVASPGDLFSFDHILLLIDMTLTQVIKMLIPKKTSCYTTFYSLAAICTIEYPICFFLIFAHLHMRTAQSLRFVHRLFSFSICFGRPFHVVFAEIFFISATQTNQIEVHLQKIQHLTIICIAKSKLSLYRL